MTSNQPQIIISGTVVDHCQRNDCEGGNCPGCINGNLWCDDPRCQPNCEDCVIPDNNFVTILIIIFVILGVIVLILLIYFIWRANRSDQVNPYYLPPTAAPSNHMPISIPKTTTMVIAPTASQAPIGIQTSQINPIVSNSTPIRSSSSVITGFEKIPSIGES